METISITTKLSLIDYVKANYYLRYRTPFMKVTPLFLLFAIIAMVNIYSRLDLGYLGYFIIAGFITVIILNHTLSYFRIKKNYYNSRISETIIYNISNETIHTKGETFDSSFTWDKIYKVSETKSWIFIWQTKNLVNIIPKRDLTSDQLHLLKTIVSSHKEVKNKMK